MSNNDYDDYWGEDNRTPPEPSWKTKKWESEHSTGQSAGVCKNCGSKIFQSTYTDFCMCGENDTAY
jgi:hypothetical protein